MSQRLKQPPLPTPEPERFRRRQFVAPHRRRSLIVRVAKPFAAAFALVAVPTALAGWVLLSDQFTVREVTVKGTEKVAAAWAAERLEALAGRHLFGVGLADVEAALAGHDWVEGVRLRRGPPDRLEVEVLERVPAALVAVDGRLAYLDRAGRIIAPFDPSSDPGGLVLLSTPEGRSELAANGLELLDTWRRRRLPYAEGLSEIRVLSPTDYRVITAALPFPVFVSSLNLAEGLASLVEYGPQLEKRLSRLAPFGAVDLRFRGRILFQPAARKPHNLEGAENA